jgi:hypothetical protein
MGNIENYRSILGSLRYKSATDIDQIFQLSLFQTTKENVEFDRSINIELEQVFDDERQLSDVIRPAAKLSLIFKNQYSGTTKYYPYSSSLYYENINDLVKRSCTNDTSTVFSGYPQYYEFDFMRNDNNISGYTIPDVNNVVHSKFSNFSGYNYNWTYYLSYAYENVYNKSMTANESTTNTFLSWNSGDGIPFVILLLEYNGRNVVQFRCPMNHGLSVGESVELSFDYQGNTIFQVDSLGDFYYGSEETIFNVFNPGFIGNVFQNFKTGTFKRVLNPDNITETKSIYYVRKHKILTTETDAVITKTGFEGLIYSPKKQLVKSIYSPNRQDRISIKENNSIYNLTFTKDISINQYRDNLIRPISELFITIVWKGFYGWTFGNPNLNNSFYPMKQGWEFNLQPFSTMTNTPSYWWDDTNFLSNTNLSFESYTTPTGPKPFTYIKPLTTGDTIDGEYCEFNYTEQLERVISDYYHKIKFNSNYFTIVNNPSPDNPWGYYYKPHNSITIKTYSDYIETADPNTTESIPDYAYYSQTNNSFIWRDLYPFGFVDANNIGVNYPFINNTHYPYRDIIFRLIPEGSTYVVNDVTKQPTIDNCE